MHKFAPWLTRLIGMPPVPTTADEPTEPDHLPIQITTEREQNRGTVASGIRVGDAHFCYYEETKNFHTLALYCSPEWLLTPGYMDACALYQAMKLLLIEGKPELVGEEFEKRMRGVGATWPYLRAIEIGGKQKLWVGYEGSTNYADTVRLTSLFSDLTRALDQAGLDPEQYFALPH